MSELREFIIKQRSKGKNDEEIRVKLVDAGWDHIVIHRALAGDYDAVAASSYDEHKDHLTGSQILLVVGLVFIVIATILFVSNSWSDLSALTKFLIIFIPNMLLFAIGKWLSGKEDLVHIKNGVLAVGLVMLPGTIGTFLFQNGIFKELNSTLYLVSLMIPLPAYYYASLFKRQNYGTLLVLLDSIVIFFILNDDKGIDPALTYAITLLMAVGLAVLYMELKERASKIYQGITGYLTVLLFAISITGIILALSKILFEGNRFAADFSVSTYLLVSLLGGFVLGVMTMLIGRYLKPITQLEVGLQRFMMILTLLAIFIPLFNINNNNDRAIYLLIPVCLAGLLVYLGLLLGSKLLYVISIIAGVISILMLVFSGLGDVAIPIIMFIVGFIAIGLSIALAKTGLVGKKMVNEAVAESLGFVTDEQRRSIEHFDDEGSVWAILSKVLFVIVAFVLFFSFIAVISFEGYYY